MNYSIQHFLSNVRKCILVICIFLSYMTSLLSQACTVCSQTDADNWETVISTSNIVISGADITNLDGMSELTGLSNVFGNGGRLIIKDSPLLENIDGLSNITNIQRQLEVSNNPLLQEVSFPAWSGSISYIQDDYQIKIINNSSLASIQLPLLGNCSSCTQFPTKILIENNDSLITFEQGAGTTFHKLHIINNDMLTDINLPTTIGIDSVLISDNGSLVDLEGLQHLVDVDSMTIMDNPSLYSYCDLYTYADNESSGNVFMSGNLINLTKQGIIFEGRCGNFVRNTIGYETLDDALNEANDYDIIFVAGNYIVDSPTTFSNAQNHTLFIRPFASLTFTAPFTNEGIIINHGILEMMPGAIFTNSGAFVNTGQLIAN